MKDGLQSKVWWKSKTILAMLLNLAFVWSLYFFEEFGFKLAMANSLFAIAGIGFRAIGDKAINLKNVK